MAKDRLRRVAELIRRELSFILLKDIQIPEIGFVTLTQVKVSADLQQAQVYVSIFNEEEVQQHTLLELESHALEMQHLLKKRLRLRYIPNLEFILDQSAEYSDYIARRLMEIKAQDRKKRTQGKT